MDLNQLSPYIRVAWDSIIYPPVHIAERVIFDYELMFVKEGECEVTVEENRYYGKPGDLFLFKPNQVHSITLLNGKPLRQPHLHFDLYYQPDSPEVKVSYRPYSLLTEQEKQWIRPDSLAEMEDPLPNHIRLNKPGVIEQLIQDIIFEFDRKFPYYETTAKGLFIQLWVLLLREIHWQRNTHLHSNWEQLDRVKNYVSHHIEHDLTLDELADLANMSKYYLCRLFKKAYGMTPIQYHVSIRLEKAKQMIQFTNLPLTQIADELGFQSIHAFSRTFRKWEGHSPSSFRKKK
ncbi:AraC family transcriptional regulator [Cohnella herbarum]|uniref:AraC family transcriptional regulator n=1 Tax=Cohnella herbarum TaxID=2728023 RepID=A0A7Z2ZNY8_9BACL|nr:AraC family transcriptional regulator [Cohnella herbarum]QJD86916.1 AraC family transcriptional regulator [Cohnella herbarum]